MKNYLNLKDKPWKEQEMNFSMNMENKVFAKDEEGNDSIMKNNNKYFEFMELYDDY